MIDIDFGLHLAPIQEHNTCTDLLNSPGSTNVFTAMMNPWIHITSTGGGIACDPGTAWHVPLCTLKASWFREDSPLQTPVDGVWMCVLLFDQILPAFHFPDLHRHTPIPGT